MCALSPLFPVCEWPLDAPINHEQPMVGFGIDEFFRFSPSLPQLHHHHRQQLDTSPSFTTESGTNNPTVKKKLNHNASERDRRRKINTLYSSLRSLLPLSDQKKRLSIPATVSRVLKYIPELHAEVERLVQNRSEILAKISRQDEAVRHGEENTRKCSSRFVVSVNRVSEREVAVQLSNLGPLEPPLSHILLRLEEDGLFLVEASCFWSCGGRVFYNLYFQVEENCNLEEMALNEKLLSLYEKWRELFT